MKKQCIATAALISALGLSTTASAQIVELNWTGLFTIVSPEGGGVVYNSTSPDKADFFGIHTNIRGAMTFDTATGEGTFLIDSFEFLGSQLWFPSPSGGNAGLQMIGNGAGGEAGNLMVLSSYWWWGTADDYPFQTVWDVTGFLNAGPFRVGQVITGGAPSSTPDDQGLFGSPYYDPNYNTLLAGVPMAMTTWNVNYAYDGTVLLTDDGITGVPILTPPYPDHNLAIDVLSLTVTAVTPAAVPVPAAAWLLGSGLLALLGCARGKAAA